MRKTKIVVTLGPSLDDYDLLKEVFRFANVARFNFSHGSHREHEKRLKLIRELEEELKKPIVAMADTKGPEVRIKRALNVEKGALYDFSEFAFEPKDAVASFEEGDVVFVDDGNFMFIVENGQLRAMNGGALKENKGVIIKGKGFDLPSITKRDAEDLEFISSRFDAVAQSFVRSPKDYNELRAIVGEDVVAVAKIETKEASRVYESLVEVYDGVMVARGDLALSIPVEELPSLQHRIVGVAKKHLKFSIIATQLLESMTSSPFPMRSEVIDIYNAVMSGADGIMLSGETAAGFYPLEAVRLMHTIALKAESEFGERQAHLLQYHEHMNEYKNVISFSAVNMASVLSSSIIAPTVHGTTPRKLSRLRSDADIYTITPNKRTYRLLTFFYAVFPKLGDFEPIFERFEELKAMFELPKAVFVFGYPPGNHKTNTIIYI